MIIGNNNMGKQGFVSNNRQMQETQITLILQNH